MRRILAVFAFLFFCGGGETLKHLHRNYYSRLTTRHVKKFCVGSYTPASKVLGVNTLH